MEYGKILDRAVRLTQIQHLLHKNPRGLSSRELSALCGVCMRTIQRDILDLQTELHIPITSNGDRYSIIEGYLLPPVSFSLYEAMALFMASRLVLRQTDERNIHIQSAIDALSGALPAELASRLRASAQGMKNKPGNPDHIRVFEQVAIAWSTQRRMKIKYQSLRSSQLKEWLVDPYFVEMTGVGYSTYVIGRGVRKDKDGITTFKLDRIKKVELLDETFEIPTGLSLDKLLGSSWGVIWGDETEVKLKFSSEVARRIKESVWHPSQVIEDLPDGGCIMTVRVGSTLEMTPWIRGWGPDVEVLEPISLRRELAQQAAELAAIYSPNVKGMDVANE